MRNTIRDRFEDPDVFDARGILKDGAVARVRMNMRDGLPDRPLMMDEVIVRMVERRKDNLVTDGINNLFGLNRPGFRYAADPALHNAARQRVLDARRVYQDDLESAWRSPPTGAGQQHEFATPQIGNPCTKDGWNGTYQDDGDGNVVCVIDRRQDSAGKSLQQLQRDHAMVTEAAYAAYAKEISEAWKTK